MSLLESDMENQGKVLLGTGLVIGSDEILTLIEGLSLATELSKYALLVPFRDDILSRVEGGSLNELASLEIKSAPDESLMATLTVRFELFAMKFAIPLVDVVAMKWLAEATKIKCATVLMEVPETGKLGVLRVQLGVQRVTISRGESSQGALPSERARRELLADFLKVETNSLMLKQGSGSGPELGCLFVCVSRAMSDANSGLIPGQSPVH